MYMKKIVLQVFSLSLSLSLPKTLHHHLKSSSFSLSLSLSLSLSFIFFFLKQFQFLLLITIELKKIEKKVKNEIKRKRGRERVLEIKTIQKRMVLKSCTKLIIHSERERKVEDASLFKTQKKNKINAQQKFRNSNPRFLPSLSFLSFFISFRTLLLFQMSFSTLSLSPSSSKMYFFKSEK